jgi:hypothetical protein
MGGLLTVPAFLERFPQVDIVSSSSFHSAWITGTFSDETITLHALQHTYIHTDDTR